MTVQSILVRTENGRNIDVNYWPASQPKAYLHICHGMAEHINRYTDFAEKMARQGFHVIGHNHRGHGKNETLGHYSNQDGWKNTIEDIVEVQEHAIKDKSLPLFLFGHSMGSFIAQGFAIKYSDRLSGLILSGTNYQNTILYHLGRIIARAEHYRLGMGVPSHIMDKLSFGSFNGHFKPARTHFDWLSRDQDQVDLYTQDPLCGFPCSGETWAQLLSGLIDISDSKNLQKIRSSLPIYLFGGDRDPVGRMGKGIPALAKKLTETGHKNVTSKLYKNGRHEMLNETCKENVYQAIIDWVEQTLERLN